MEQSGEKRTNDFAFLHHRRGAVQRLLLTGEQRLPTITLRRSR